MTGLRALLVVGLAALLPGAAATSVPSWASDARTEVVVALASAPLGVAPRNADQLEAEQSAFRRELRQELPGARIRWRFRLVLNGFAIDLASADVARVRTLPGVRDVYDSVNYTAALDGSPGQIGAQAVWGPSLETSGQGVKIGIIDSGIDQSHAFFDPTAYSMPTGFPKGQRAFTTAKVIVARAFPPVGAPSSPLPFDDSHGTHVAGIAAGNAGTKAAESRIVSGVAPGAYLGNYKVFNGPLANSPEILAAIEAAVADGMDVLNFSGGEPEIEPSRDIVSLGLDAAAAAGVVSVVAAGNDYDAVGAGSVSSPANSARAIAVGAVESQKPAAFVHAGFSSVGPTPISLRMKPDVAAPGASILSSVPGGWGSLSGTSMAAPHVAGAAALLVQRHPDWTVAQVKSALVQTGVDTVGDGGVIRPQFQGGGVVALARADQPLLFAAPSSFSLGLLRRQAKLTKAVMLTDAGGGAGTWATSLQATAPRGTRVTVAPTVVVPGTLRAQVAASATAAEGDVSGYIVLRRGTDVRRIPFWGHVSVPALARHRAASLSSPGVVRGTTKGRPALVARYRYPEDPSGLGVSTRLEGPERVYRIRIGRGVANFGVVVTQRGPGSRVEPRVVSGADENRLTGYAGLPLAENPHLPTFLAPIPVAGALSPAPGVYSVVIDSPTKGGAGTFWFRYWLNDVKPPTVRLRDRSVRRGAPILVSVSDAGSGIYSDSLVVSVDGREVSAALLRGLVSIPTGGLQPGLHRLRVRISDFQEAKNTENVARVLPNTRLLSTTVTVRP